jgi:hypothetical protein
MAAQLKEKIQNGLGEIRILVLGAQVLLGFQFRGYSSRALKSFRLLHDSYTSARSRC